MYQIRKKFGGYENISTFGLEIKTNKTTKRNKNA